MLNRWLSYVVATKVFLRAPYVLIPTRKKRTFTSQGQVKFTRNYEIVEIHVGTFCGIGARTLGIE
jgi:hypothetical protein